MFKANNIEIFPFILTNEDNEIYTILRTYLHGLEITIDNDDMKH